MSLEKRPSKYREYLTGNASTNIDHIRYAPLYQKNITRIKSLGLGEHKILKVTTLKCLRSSGVELDEKTKAKQRKLKLVLQNIKSSLGASPCSSVNDHKLDNNIWRSQQKIFELALCNPWSLFVTFTIDKEKHDRSDLGKYWKRFSQFIRDTNKKHGIKIDYLLIPERHSDGESWHLHGLMYGLPVEILHRFVIGDKMSSYIASKIANGSTVYNWVEYQNKFGFCCIEPVKNHQAVSCYITKYINKDLYRSVTELNANLYYRSQGLKTATVLKQGTFVGELTPDWEGEYCKVTTLLYTEENLHYLLENTVSYTSTPYYEDEVL